MKHKNEIGVSIFLIAFAFGLNITGIAPILGILNQLYESKGTSAVQLLQTLPYGLLMVGSLLVGWLTSHFSKKTIAEAGLMIIGICGVIPFFFRGYEALLLSRIIIGFGFGITSPINTAIAAEFFKQEERAKYLGLHVVGMGIGSMVGNIFGGALSGFGYQWFYFVYMIAFFSLIGVSIFLPNMSPAKTEKSQHRKLNKAIYLISAASFVHTLFITVYSTNIAIYIVDYITKNTAVTGIVTGINAAFALIVGMFFASISKKLGKNALSISVLAAAAGYAAILWLPGLLGIYIGSACCGASLSCFMAQCSYQITVLAKPEEVAKASGIFSVIGGIGGLLSPIILGKTANIIFGSNLAKSQFILSFAGMLLLALCTYFAEGKKKI